MASEQELPDPIRRLLRNVGHEHETPRPRRIFTNRDLDFEKVPVVGFDMDYTLARYRQAELEALSLEATVDKLVAKGWPELLREIQPDPEFAIRGLVVDTLKGNLLKMDLHGYVGRVYHGRTQLDRPQRKAIYSSQRVGRERERFSYVDTLFSLPEVTLYAAVVDLIDEQPQAWAGGAPDYATAWTCVREAIDLAHQDDSIKSRIRADVAAYFDKDPDLAPTLHKLRSAGKKLFLLTNSFYPYTNVVMSYILGGDEDDYYEDWASYFDWCVVGSRKPGFFTKTEPFYEIDRSTGLATDKPTATPRKGLVYQGGNQAGMQTALGVSPDEVLYVGDHIYGDVVQSKKTSGWRTALVADELEREIRVRADYRVALEEILALSDLWERLSEEVSDQRYLQRGLELLSAEAVASEYAARSQAISAAQAEALLEDIRSRARARLKRLRAHEDSVAEHVKARGVEVDRAFNRYWGSVFAERHDASFFGAQLEDYACLYTSRVSNFLYVSPHRYFRAPHGTMPHWL